MGIQTAISIASILRTGEANVNITNFEIGLDAMSVLSQGLVTAEGLMTQTLMLASLRFANVERSEGWSVEGCLADCLARNESLDSFSWVNISTNDSAAAMIVRSLIGHPSLEYLRLTDVEFGADTTDAICRLLASPTCILSDLHISEHIPATKGGAGAGFNFERFLDQLPVNNSLQILDLCSFGQGVDHDSANQLLGSLWRKLPNLKRLMLFRNEITDLVKLVGNLTMTSPHSCLRELHLDCDKNDLLSQAAILHLLEVFPLLGNLGCFCMHSFPAPVNVLERLDLNRCSGMLLRGIEVPLSVWAVVLARVNRDICTYPLEDASRRANVIYHMLHGPVFAGRHFGR